MRPVWILRKQVDNEACTKYCQRTELKLNRIEEWCTYAKSAILHLNSKLQHPSKNGMYACACVRVCESVYIVGGGFF